MKTRLKNDETIFLVTRLHWFTMVVPWLITIGAIILGFVLGGYGFLLVLAAILFITYKMVERNNNIWVVTNLRVIDEFGVFSNNSKESPLDKINNVTYQQSFWGKIFGFGSVQIQTAAEIGSTSYSMVAGPSKLKDSISQMQEQYKDLQIRKQASQLAGAMAASQMNNRTDVPGELERLYDLKQRGIITEEEFINRKAKILGS